MKRILDKDLYSFCKRALVLKGMDEEDAAVTARILVTTDKWGISTHGTKNLFGYIQKKEAGGVSFSAKPVIVLDLPSMTVVDGNNAMGYISSEKAMRIACDKAKKTGIAISLVKNSCHFGAAGYYSNIAAQEGLIGCTMSNVDKKMTIPGAKGMVMGHNPFSLSAPATVIPSIILDISSSNVASLKVLRAKAEGSLIPYGWISDVNGLPTNDPSKYPDEGALLPFGNHKGYGIAMFVEMLTSVILSQPDSTSEDVHSWCFDLDKPNNVCHAFIAVNPNVVGGENAFPIRVDQFIEELHNAPKADDSEGIFVPGEGMWKRFSQAEENGIPIANDVEEELCKVAEITGLELKFLME